MSRELFRIAVILFLLPAVTAACRDNAAGQNAVSGLHTERPNILLIVVDDMGFSDLGSFGGEIATPNLDRLAYAGLRFSNFHTAPMCSPSRAMLLTGADAHVAGLGNMLEELSPNQKGQPGYEGYLNERVVTIPRLLQDAGYQTYIAGKWHLGTADVSNPAQRGFDRSFVLGSGGASHFADMRPAYAPSPEIKANYWEDGTKLRELPADFEYSSQYYVDRMIAYLKERDKTEPFFAFLSFTAPHWPLQAPDAAIAAQAGRYDAGYDALARARLARMKELELLPQDAVLSGRSPKETPWQALDEEQRRVEIRAMEVYAAMVAEIDAHTGRLFDYLAADSADDNTIVIFLSDNGAEGHDLDETWPMDAFPKIRKTIDSAHDFSFENIGRAGSYTLLGPNWANATTPAFYLHKGFPSEGGTRSTAFIYDPDNTQSAAVRHEFVSVKDIAPTILDYASVRHPQTEYEGRPVAAMTGVSIDTEHQLNSEETVRVTGVELMGKRAIRAGRWKLVHMPEPWGAGEWQLYDLQTDLAESNDVSAHYAEKVTELKQYWDVYAKQNEVILPDWVSGY